MPNPSPSLRVLAEQATELSHCDWCGEAMTTFSVVYSAKRREPLHVHDYCANEMHERAQKVLQETKHE
jgi:hypothetical protein